MKYALRLIVLLIVAIQLTGCVATYQAKKIVFEDGDTFEKGVVEQGNQASGAWKYTDAQTGESRADVIHGQSLAGATIPAVFGGSASAAITVLGQKEIAKINNKHCKEVGCGGDSGDQTNVFVEGGVAQAVANPTATAGASLDSTTTTGPCGKATCPTLGRKP